MQSSGERRRENADVCLSTVIASQRVRAKRGPMTGSAKQSRAMHTTLDCFVAALLAMTVLAFLLIVMPLAGGACSIPEASQQEL
jgi:hypothetical protein